MSDGWIRTLGFCVVAIMWWLIAEYAWKVPHGYALCFGCVMGQIWENRK